MILSDTQSPRQGLYIHIPFCRSRCLYCDFYSTQNQFAHEDAYVDSLLGEMRQRHSELPERDIDTIYIGGGTPSTLSPQNLARLIRGVRQYWELGSNTAQSLTLSPINTLSPEITVEANPDDITPTMAAALTDMGVNRVSMGAQSFHDKTLRFLHRRHTAAQVEEAITHLRHAGIHNISIDLIYGLPFQTLADWEDDLRQAFALPVTHLSAYALTYEPGTPLSRLKEQGRIRETDDDTEWRMYQALMEAADAHGFRHYEISNFALPSYHSRHNSGYWHGMRYMGLGPAAHSYNGNTRRWNKPLLSRYIQSRGLTGITPLPSAPAPPNADTLLYDCEHLTPQQKQEEMLLTSLRTARGLILETYAAAFGQESERSLLLRAQPYIDNGDLLVERTPASTRIHLSRKAIFRSDGIIAALFAD